ncbi:hypothetical protein HD_0869 [[Haemophilus] ducreyi 35000HP]|uniref:Uncharacterized protein n=1 Tax=Haemophilus ducreyi (strain 35000HP / ATCC 700724) TaxID=233412 RepID=Q7VMU7_HAEDU|nr:hypothetical protein HD_0869 [[Haemophilus] ducreyi 35000HP]
MITHVFFIQGNSIAFHKITLMVNLKTGWHCTQNFSE